MTTFISLAISDTMFPAEATMRKAPATPADVQAAIENGAVSALNPSHTTTIDAIRRRFGIEIPVPALAPKVALQAGEFECLLCAGAQSGEALSYEAHRVWQNTVDEQPLHCRRKRAWRRG